MSSSPTAPSAHPTPPEPPGGRRAVMMWSVGVAVYFVAVTFRTSLGVAALDAADRFEVSASALSTFSLLQLLVYAGMQIPVGLLVDRWGTRRVLILGAALFTTGQFGFALAETYPLALVCRALLGCGDALTFISVLRLGTRWFPARRSPFVAQLAGLVGMTGNLVTTLVLARVLSAYGWTATFAGSAAAGAVVLLLVLLFLRDHPEGFEPEPVPLPHGSRTAPRSGDASSPLGGGAPTGAAYVRRQTAAAWREPGTRLGMWVHFTTQFPAMVFLLLWGMPFLIKDQGLDRAQAGTLLTLVVASNLVIGLAYGQLLARHHAARTPLALGTVGATAGLWAGVLLWPGPAPTPLLATLCVVLGACGPASMIGFDFARPANPPERQGTASGIVNIGGFTASMTTLLTVGVLLDLTGDDFRIALSVVFVIQALGVSQILRLRARAHRRERERIVASRVEAVHVPV